MSYPNDNINLNTLSLIENFSIRTYNVCTNNKLHDLFKLLDYYNKKGTFLELPNCGKKSNHELVSICQKYNYISQKNKEPAKNKTEIQEKYISLSLSQKEYFEQFLIIKIDNLSDRSTHSLDRHFKFIGMRRGIKKILLEDQTFNPLHLKGIGQKTSEEITVFFESLKDQLFSSHQLTDKETEFKKLRFLLISNFKFSPSMVEQVLEKYHPSEGVPIFKIFHILLEKLIHTKKNWKEILERRFNYWHTKGYRHETLEKTAEVLNITRERVRQIQEKIYALIHQKMLLFNVFSLKPVNLHGLDINSDLLLIPSDIVHRINKIEETSFNEIFICDFLSVFLSHTYSIVGNCRNVILRKSSSVHSWNKIYLLKKEIRKDISINNLIIDVANKLKEKRDKDIFFPLEAYISKFQQRNFNRTQEQISRIIIKILRHEFKITELDIQKNKIIFRRNQRKSFKEHVFDILQQAGKPLSAPEIIQRLPEDITTPIKKKTDLTRKIQGLCQNSKNIFIPIGRNSTYALKEWEKEGRVKGGSMLDLVEEFLRQSGSPKPLQKITDYIGRYRKDVNPHKLLSNLKVSNSSLRRNFLFLPDDYIGLKDYSPKKEVKPEASKGVSHPRTWEESFSLLSEFIHRHRRRPSQSGEKEEKRLSSFMHAQIYKMKNQGLDKEKKERINFLLNTIEYKKILPRKWEENFQALSLFITEHERPPNYSSEGEEKRLHRFMHAQISRMKKSLLSEAQKEKINSFLRLISYEEKRPKSWEENFQALSLFITEHERPPNYSSEGEEKRLHRFMHAQISRMKKSLLSEAQKEKINSFLRLISYEEKRPKSWEENFQALSLFIKEHERPPNHSSEGEEKRLYGFMKRQFYKMKTTQLTPEQKKRIYSLLN